MLVPPGFTVVTLLDEGGGLQLQLNEIHFLC